MSERIPIADITIGERRRQDLGDIAALADTDAMAALRERYNRRDLSPIERSRALVAMAGIAANQLREEYRRSGPRPTPPSWVYFIREGYAHENGPVKIGVSIDPPRRLTELLRGRSQRLHIIGVMAGKYELEQSLHARFQSAREEGEWFRLTDDLAAFIRDYARPWTSSC